MKNNDLRYLSIITFLWGPWFEKDVEYLTKMRNMLQRNVTIPYEFVCLTSRPDLKIDGIKMMPLYCFSRYNNLPKLSLFNPRYNFKRMFAIDLDVIILKNIDHMLTLNSEICVRSAFKSKKLWKPDGDLQLIDMTKKRRYEIWNFITRNKRKIEKETRGKERRFYDYYSKTLFPNIKFFQKEFPGEIKSFKQHKINHTKIVPDEAKIVTFHGKPKPHECMDEQLWLENYWV